TQHIEFAVQVELFRLMVLCRVLENACCELNSRWFPAEGEEAAIVGSFFGLRPDDFIAPHYRGPFIAYYLRGAELPRLIGQVLAKANGYSRGRALGFTGPIEQRALPWVAGDLGTSLGVATGTAVGHQYDGTDRVTVCTFGDGTTNRGDFHEALNLAAVWRLPIVYVCQHNQYSISLHSSQVLACDSIASRAAGYGMPGVSVDGNDALAVHAAVQEAIGRARSGHGPTLIEACSYRLGGHWASDPGGYRSEEDVAAWRAKDPITRLHAALLESGALDQEEIERVWADARSQVAAAVEEAQAAPSAEGTGLGLEEVFAPPSFSPGGSDREGAKG
ncbi:MAG TPA: thiamine pyrophosphate-dependent dehydrogenase E1 component subunit alpha, partial [Chloroflexota bacterium]|nr:thiamine pyrophosphate-dependent dehydrogenase E1 component subunit alpha [Chloroflexota bacterium]